VKERRLPCYLLKTVLSTLIIFNFSLCPAQEDLISKSSYTKLNLKLAYISSVIYPGVSAGVEFPIKQYSNYITKNKRTEKYFSKSRFITANINWYHHPGFHDNFYLTSEWLTRRTRPTGYVSEFYFGPGFSRTFNGGTTYKVDNNGTISIVKRAGYYYALATFGGGWGYDFSVKKQQPYSVFAKGNMLIMFPYNSTIYLRPVLEIGSRYIISGRKVKLPGKDESKSNQ
jgi:hypothetical protein